MELKYKTWKDISIGLYKKLLNITDSNMDIVDTEIAIIALLCDCDEEDILNLTIPEYQKLRASAQWIATRPKGKAFCPKSIKLDNQYDIVSDMSKLTTAQYIDFQSYIKMNDLNKYISHILAIFFIPKGKKYGDVPPEEIIADIDKNLNIQMAEDMCFFFMTEFMTLTKITLHYLESKMKKMVKNNNNPEVKKKMEEIHSLINGIGYIK